MAGKKRKAASASQQSPGKKASSSSRSQRIKPSVEIVEVSSDPTEQPHTKGIERGLCESNKIQASFAKQSVEQEGDEGGDRKSSNDQTTRRMTRGSRNGRTDDRKNYDMKCTPNAPFVQSSSSNHLARSSHG